MVHKDNVAHKVVEGEIYISYAGGYYDFTFEGELASGERIVGEAQSLWSREEKEIPPYFLYRNESEFLLKIEGGYGVDTTYTDGPARFGISNLFRTFIDDEGNNVEFYETVFFGAVDGLIYSGIYFPLPFEIETPSELETFTFALDCSLGNIVLCPESPISNTSRNYSRLSLNMNSYHFDIPRHLVLSINRICAEDEIEDQTQHLLLTIEGVSKEYETFNVTIEGNADGVLRDPYDPDYPITDRVENIPFYLEYKNIKIQECL